MRFSSTARDVDFDEYILLTAPCCDAVGREDSNLGLSW